MAILTGFPPSNTISPSVRIAEQDLSYIAPEQSFHRVGLVGFASKGPINVPTLVTSIRMLNTLFGYPHPDVGDPYLIYAAQQYLTAANELYIVRVADQDAVSDEAAATAEIDVVATGGKIVFQSATSGPYTFDRPMYMRWKVNGILQSKTLAVEASNGTYPLSITCANLVSALNDQLSDGGVFNTSYGIRFVCNSNRISIESTFAYGPDATIELVSVKDQFYGGATGSITHPTQIVPGGNRIDNPIGLGIAMTPAISTGGNCHGPSSTCVANSWDFSGLTGLTLQVVVDGTDVSTIDNVVQTLDLSALDGTSTNTAGVVTAINTAIALNVGGFECVASGGYITLKTLHKGFDARLLVKSTGSAAIFGFDSLTKRGDSGTPVDSTGDTTQPAEVYGDDGSDEITFTLTADSAGTEGNYTSVVITNDIRENVFSMDVFNASGGTAVQVETWGNLVKDPSSNFYVATFLELVSDYIRVLDNPLVSAPPRNGTYQLTGGSDGVPSNPDDQDALICGNLAGMTGMMALSEPEQVDIDLIAVPGHASTAVIMCMLELCQTYRQDCFAIVDPPFGLTVNEIIQWQNGTHPLNTTRFDSDFGALYWPWVKIYDTFNRVDVWIPPSGSVLAVYARNDFLAAPWFAPAGLNRGNVPNITDVFDRPTLAERDSMYGNRNCVNPIVQFVDLGGGFVVWGQKTLQRKPTALDRVNVRRMLLAVEKQIRRASRELLFEPNDLRFRLRFVEIVSKILKNVQTNRGLYDYIIQADSQLNTPDVIDRNEFRARIGIQPTKAVEFIYIEFSLHRTGSFVQNADNMF